MNKPIDHAAESLEVEGLDENQDQSWGQYSLDSVFVRNENRSVSDIIRRIDNKRYIMDPDFQREFVWPEDKQSKLIESCVLRIPLPVFYLAEAEEGKVIVVDGLQRLTTFRRFIKGLFKLKGLGDHLDGHRFSSLPTQLQERILDTQLITYILDSKAPERARLDIFERVNSGVPLTRQQMRNALYSGQATNWLKQAAESQPFKIATGSSLDPKAMRDREAINRFCAFSLLQLDSYKGDMEAFLAQTLAHMNKMEPGDLFNLRLSFDQSMRFNRQLFGDHAFRKSLGTAEEGGKRNVLNIALFDVCSTLMAKHSDRLSVDSSFAQLVKIAIRTLVKEQKFLTAITYSTNSTAAVTTRFDLAERVLKECL